MIDIFPGPELFASVSNARFAGCLALRAFAGVGATFFICACVVPAVKRRCICVCVPLVCAQDGSEEEEGVMNLDGAGGGSSDDDDDDSEEDDSDASELPEVRFAFFRLFFFVVRPRPPSKFRPFQKRGTAVGLAGCLFRRKESSCGRSLSFLTLAFPAVFVVVVGVVVSLCRSYRNMYEGLRCRLPRTTTTTTAMEMEMDRAGESLVQEAGARTGMHRFGQG